VPDERLLYPPAGPIAPTRDADRRPADALARQIPRLLKRDNRGYPFELPASRSTTLRHLRKKEKPRRQRGSLRLTGSSVRDPNRGARGKKVARGVKGTVRRAGVTKIKKPPSEVLQICGNPGPFLFGRLKLVSSLNQLSNVGAEPPEIEARQFSTAARNQCGANERTRSDAAR